MKKYLFDEDEINLVKHLLKHPPNRIWYDYVWYVFEYNDYHLRLDCYDESADTQNKYDEAIIAKMIKEDKKFEPSQEYKLVYKDKKIETAYIVRTFLYFTTVRMFSEDEITLRRETQKIKTSLTGKQDPLEEILSDTIGYCQEIICHPNSEEAKKVNIQYSNLLDVGLLLEVEGKFLKAYIANNGFGFPVWNDKYFFEAEELKEEVKFYDFIKIQND